MIERTPHSISWTQMRGDLYICTGVTRQGKRFRFETPHWSVAQAIHIHRGSRWLFRDGKRALLQRIP